MNIIEVKNASKSFGKKQILKNISFNVEKGDRLVIIGPNGSGKSTAVNSIVGLLRLDEGIVEYPYYKKQKNFLSNVGVQFQESNLPPGFKVREVIESAFELNFNSDKFPNKQKWIEKEMKPWFNKLVKVFNVEHILDKNVLKLSGGQKQAINILLSMVSKPEVLILDEITTGLDIRAQERILSFIDDFVTKNNTTLIVVSHILKEINTLGNRFVIIDNQKIVADRKFSQIGRTEKSIDNFMKDYFLKGKVKK